MPARFPFLAFVVCASGLLFFSLGDAQQLATTNAPAITAGAPGRAGSPTLTSPTDASQKIIADAFQRMNANDIDGALNDLSQAIRLNPNSTGAYVLRASIYCQKKLWTQAEDDFKSAARIAPSNNVLKFNLVDVKFMQKQYDLARPGFVTLQKDPDLLKNAPEMSDFAAYKVFLCDLFGGHEAAARKELDIFNDAMGNPSYYFGNAAWDLVHKNIEDARSWLLSASRIYPPRKNAYYAKSLQDLGYLPLPAPPQQ